MSVLKKPMDFKLLECELDDALKADELYKLQNDAKIRAIDQKVPTYDHFRNMVLAAHLKPLEKSEFQNKTDVSWNHCCSNKDRLDLQTRGKSQLLSKPIDDCNEFFKIDRQIQNESEFVKAWQSITDTTQKFNLLFHYKKYLKNKFFKIEVPSELLSEILQLGLEICSEDNVFEFIDVLQVFSECNRFSLSLAMIPLSVKSQAQRLFEKLLTFVKTDEDVGKVKELSKRYSLVLN